MNRTDIPSDPNIRWEWIKYQLRARGQSLAKLARSLGVSNQAVKNAKLTPYPRVERTIAAALDLSPMALWPDRWLDDENPKRQRPNRSETLQTYGSYTYDSVKNNKYGVLSHRKAVAGA